MRTIGWTALLLAGLAGCGKGKDSDSGGPSPDLVFTDANNYSYTGSMSINPIAVASGADATVDWCGLTTDLRGRSVVPSEVDRLILIELELSQAEALAKIEANDLTQADTVTQWIFQNEQVQGCTANLSDFSILANDFDPADFVQSSHTWLLSATYFVDSRFDFVMSAFVVPTDGEANTTIALTDTTAKLDFQADLHSLTPLRTAAGHDRYTLDWSGVTVDVNGKPFDEDTADQVLVGKVAASSVAEVEDIFLRVDSEAEALYRLYTDENGVPVVAGERSADLMLATDASGNPFPGFTTDGIWLVGLECRTCTVPAPVLLTVVEVE